MMHDRLSIQRDLNGGGWYVVVDGATKRFDTKPEAIRAACEELDGFKELTAMNTELSLNIVNLENTNARLKKSLNSTFADFEKLRGELEQEKSEKNKWILEAYNWKETVTKLGKHIARTCV